MKYLLALLIVSLAGIQACSLMNIADLHSRVMEIESRERPTPGPSDSHIPIVVAKIDGKNVGIDLNGMAFEPGKVTPERGEPIHLKPGRPVIDLDDPIFQRAIREGTSIEDAIREYHK